MKKIIATLSIFVVLLAGCTPAGASSYEYAGACDGKDAKVGVVTDTGGVNDKSFNQGTWEGVEKYCADNNVGGTYIESTDASQVKANLEKMASTDGIEVVVASGFNFANDMYTVAKEYPDVDFVLIDAEPTNPETSKVEKLDNVDSYLFSEQEAGYLVGYVAGKTTQTNRVGFVGGEANPPVQRFGYGYLQGVNDANPDATVDYNYTGTFSDPTIGNTTANTMVQQGADVIFASAGGTNNGVVKSGIDSTKNGTPVWVIGVDRDMYEDGIYQDADGNEKSVILTSAVKKVDKAAYEGVTSHFNGDKFGQTYTLGLAEEGVGLPAENPNMDAKLADEALKSLQSKGEIATDKDAVEKAISIKVNGKL